MKIECATGESLTIDADSLVGVNLKRPMLHRAILESADMRSAQLGSAFLRGAVMASADLSDADLTGADLRVANLDGAWLHRAILRNCQLAGAEFERADLTDADLEGSDVGGASFEKAVLNGANMLCTRLSEASFAGCQYDDKTVWPAGFSPPPLPWARFGALPLPVSSLHWRLCMNAIDILRSDHARLRQLLPRLHDISVAAGERKRLLESVEQELKMHAMVEEEIFYPAYKDAAHEREDRDMYFESIEEHHVVDMLLPELMPLDASSDGFRAKAKVLNELFEHHAKEEEEELFQRAEALLGEGVLRDLGQRIMARKNELDQQWSTRTGSAMRKAQSIVEKFAPTSVKDARVDANREEDRR